MDTEERVFQGFDCERCRSDYHDGDECTCFQLVEYEPYPFIPREMNAEEYAYTQKVNWVELQCADGDPPRPMCFNLWMI